MLGNADSSGRVRSRRFDVEWVHGSMEPWRDHQQKRRSRAKQAGFRIIVHAVCAGWPGVEIKVAHTARCRCLIRKVGGQRAGDAPAAASGRGSDSALPSRGGAGRGGRPVRPRASPFSRRPHRQDFANRRATIFQPCSNLAKILPPTFCRPARRANRHHRRHSRGGRFGHEKWAA